MEEEDINDVIHEEEEEFVYVGDTLAPQHVVCARVSSSSVRIDYSSRNI